jgi:hypothetical protein
MNKKNIYKKSLAMDLIRLDNNFLHSMRNREKKDHQVWVFEDTEKFIADLVWLTTKDNVMRSKA